MHRSCLFAFIFVDITLCHKCRNVMKRRTAQVHGERGSAWPSHRNTFGCQCLMFVLFVVCGRPVTPNMLFREQELRFICRTCFLCRRSICVELPTCRSQTRAWHCMQLLLNAELSYLFCSVLLSNFLVTIVIRYRSLLLYCNQRTLIYLALRSSGP